MNTSTTKGFQVNIIFRRWLDKCKRRIVNRLDKSKDTMTFEPEFSASNIHYEVANRIGGISCGGIGAIHLLARRIGLIDAINQRLHLLKFHLPYHESQHVLNFAYNALCNATCLQDIELRRNDENYLNALGTRRIPDPTTAGDFWALTLANTGEVLSIVNRPGNRPSHEGAAEEADRVVQLCGQAGFRLIELRGDTDFSQTRHLDGWDSDPRIRFYFGYDATPNLKESADNLPKSAWRPLQRPARYSVKTQPRGRRTNVKEQIVKEREFENLRLVSEDVAEFDYRPTACGNTYRMVVVRKNISVEKGEQVLFPDERYFFYITNERECTADQVVFEANDRCNQENHIAQLKGAVRALHAPVDNLESNWAYMLMTALAWNLKAWWALSLPETPGRWQEKRRGEKQWVLKLEFKTFLNAFVLLPCQILKTGRKLVYRLLGWNPHLPIFFRLLDVLHC